MQIFLIAYLTGILWLRRNPLSLIFSAISPFSLLFILFIVSEGKYLPLSITGSLVMALVGYGLSLGQDISFYKNEYKIQDVFVASPVSPITYMVGLAISQILFGLPALLVLISLATLFLSSAIYIPLLLVTTFLVWASMSSMGFFYHLICYTWGTSRRLYHLLTWFSQSYHQFFTVLKDCLSCFNMFLTWSQLPMHL